jgi:hypothetical protein
MTHNSTNQNEIETKIERVASQQLESHFANCPFEKSKKQWFDAQLLRILVAILVTVGPFILAGFTYIKDVEKDFDKRLSVAELNIQQMSKVEIKLDKIDTRMEKMEANIVDIKIQIAKGSLAP